MTDLPTFTLSETSLDQIAEMEGRIVIFMPESGKLDQSARRVNRLMRIQPIQQAVQALAAPGV